MNQNRIVGKFELLSYNFRVDKGCTFTFVTYLHSWHYYCAGLDSSIAANNAKFMAI